MEVTRAEKKSARSSRLDGLAVLYCQILVCISVVIVFAAFLDTSGLVIFEHIHWLSMYQFIVANIFLIYALIAIPLKKRSTVEPQSIDNKDEPVPPKKLVEHNGEGMNGFLKAGMLAFTLGSVVLDVLRLSMFAETADSWACHGAGYFISAVVRCLFVILLTIFLLLHDKVVINFHKPLMQFGTVHVIASNVSVWSGTVILEASHAFHNDDLADHRTANYTGENITDLSTLIRINHRCYRPRTIYDDAGDYLFPFMIEFALIGATVMYKIYCNIGMHLVHQHYDSEEESEEGGGCLDKTAGPCSFFTACTLGTILLAGTIAGIIVFLLHEHDPNSEGAEFITGYTYAITDVVLNFTGFVAVIFSLYHFNKLYFTGHGASSFDQNLLFISLLGFIFLFCFRLSTEMYFAKDTDLAGDLAKIGLLASLFNICQSLMQVTLIRDGCYRIARDNDQVHRKPGRNWLSLLICVNLSLWLVNTFQMKEIYNGAIFKSMYGTLTWLIIVHMFLPLAIFFRFHSAVCLSDLWIEAYERERLIKLDRHSMKKELNGNSHTTTF